MKIKDMEFEVDVFEFEKRKWVPVASSHYYDKRFILCWRFGLSIGSSSRGFHQDSEFEVIGRINSAGKYEEVKRD